MTNHLDNKKFPSSMYLHPTNKIIAGSGSRLFLTYPVLWLVVCFFSGYFSNQYQAHALAILLVSMLTATLRIWQCNRIGTDDPITWRKWYAILTLFNAAMWSAIGIFVISIEESNAISFAWLMGIAGIVSGGVAYLAILPWLSIAFQTILIVPICVILALEHLSSVNIISAFGLVYWLQMIRMTLQRTQQHTDNLTDKFMLQRYAKQLKQASEIDTLTKIANRGRFEVLFEREWQRAFRLEQEISLLMLDLDNFKSINDTYGHQIGDRILQEFANVLKRNVERSTDVVARYGGEEFIVLLPDTNKEGAKIVAERLRMQTEEISISAQNKQVGVTVSIGIDCAEPTLNTMSQTMFIKRADDALYQAKQLGKNRVNFAQS